MGLVDAEVHVAHKVPIFKFTDSEYNELRLGDFKRPNELPPISDDGQLPKDSSLSFLEGL